MPPECTSNDDCISSKVCINTKCHDPCKVGGTCGINAHCRVRNHYSDCYCPEGFVGDPYSQCRPVTRDELYIDRSSRKNGFSVREKVFGKSYSLENSLRESIFREDLFLYNSSL